MQRLIIASDSHSFDDTLKHIALYESSIYKGDLLFYLCGDSESTETDIYPFISVKGNMDSYPFCQTLIIPAYKHNILVHHGDKLNDLQIELLMQQEKCDIVIQGHTHIYKETFLDGKYYLNPGSVTYPRGGSVRSYMRIDIDDNGGLTCTKVLVDDMLKI